MDAILRALVTYLFLLLVIRLGGKRTIAQLTTFDFVLLLVIGESTQQAILGNDFSMINAAIVIVTLLTVDFGLSFLKRILPATAGLTEGYPVLLVDNGKPLSKRLKRVRVDEDDILEAARRLRGLERMDQIKYAVLERDGGITVIGYAGPGELMPQRATHPVSVKN